MSALAHQRCFHHSLREAVARCPECRQFYCRECVTEHDDRMFCAACLRKRSVVAAPARRSFAWAVLLVQSAIGFGTLGHYGLFARMTTTRREIEIEGSNDGNDWRVYGFPHKPGALDEIGWWIIPHQPRVDWQMWFAALGDVRSNPWFVNLLVRTLQGSPEVLAFYAWNPFPNHPPRQIRAVLYDYHFTRAGESGWWRRERRGL